MWVAVEMLDPQVPETLCKPPSVRLATLRFRPAPTLAVADPVGAMLRSPATEVPVTRDLAPLPEKIRLPYVCAETFCAPVLS